MGGGINISRSPGEERSSVGKGSFSCREAGCRGLAVSGAQVWVMGALGEGILREHLSPEVGLGVQQKENVVVLPILPWIPTRETLGGCWGFSAVAGV